MSSVAEMSIANRRVAPDAPVYFIADISANHDGDLGRAKALIHLAAESGADAAKFQNFRAEKIVSERGFAAIPGNASHQAKWKKSVVQVYKEATLPWEWTGILSAECRKAGIHYFSTPYDFDAVDMLDPFVPAFKIGSGDITWPEMLRKVASKGKPVILATGASSLVDVQRAMDVLEGLATRPGLVQCNTNYTGSPDNFRHIHLNVLRTYQLLFPNAVLGLSDHTPRHAAVLGAVALGARLIEKHFTDDTSREGPDHPFSMTPATWREMVDRTRELELALGDANKRVGGNEGESIIVQRRCIRAAKDLSVGTVLERGMLDVLRPAPAETVPPYEIDVVIGKRLRADVRGGDALRWTMLED
ncbi:MAG TPA: N-acetylneuraminate synthase family protein [Bryobacteraceae bacterium]|nr:N-acetylneuraminate synthase family protein [Bryobacteraceae bacterium]